MWMWREFRDMKLIQVLYEDQSYSLSPEDTIKLITKKCKKFINESKGKPVYRGTRNSSKDLLVKKNVRTRKLTGTYGKAFDGINKAMAKDNMPFTRANALLATGNRSQSKAYGATYQIYMIRDFKFLWSPKIYDYAARKDVLLKIYGNEGSQFYGHYYKLVGDQKWEEASQFYWDKIKDAYSDKNLSSAIQSGNEIMFNGKDYFAVNIDHEDYRTIWHRTKFV
jgi:hypothetical protein